jgi:hypothetical protein
MQSDSVTLMQLHGQIIAPRFDLIRIHSGDLVCKLKTSVGALNFKNTPPFAGIVDRLSDIVTATQIAKSPPLRAGAITPGISLRTDTI